MFTLGQELAGSYQKSQGIDITTDRDQHNSYQNMVAQDTIDDISFLSNNYNLGINLNTVNNHNTNIEQVTSTPSIFNSQTANNNIEFAGLDKEAGDNFAPLIVLGVLGLTSYLNTPEEEGDVKTGPTNAVYLIPGTSAVKLISTYGTRALTKGMLTTGAISGGIDFTAQTVYKAIDPTQEYNVKDILTSTGMGMTGSTIANVNNIQKASTAVKTLYGIATDATVSATSQYIKTGKVEAENVAVDVLVGQGGSKLGDSVKTKIVNSPEMKRVDNELQRIQNKIDRIQDNPTKVAKTNTKQNILNDIKTAKQNKIDGTVIRTTATATGVVGEAANRGVDLDDNKKSN